MQPSASASQTSAVPGLIAFVIAITLLMLAAFLNSVWALAIGLSGLAFLFATIMVQQLTVLPYLNPVALISAGTGVFYFLGSALNQFVRAAMPANPFIQFNRVWANYDVLPTIAAALIVVLCCYAGVWSSRLFTVLTQRVDKQPRAAIVALVLGVVAVFLSYLVLTGKLTVTSGARALKAAEDSEWLTLAGAAAPAAALPLAYLVLSRDAARYRTLGLIFALPIVAANFMLGRRYVIALGLSFIIGLIVYRKVHIKWWQWTAAIVSAIIVVAALTVPFNNLRTLNDTGRQFTFKEAAAVMLSGERVQGAGYMGAADMLALTAARADILRELAQVADRMPASGLTYGEGIISQAAVVVPGQFWPDKKVYMATEMYSDGRILNAAGMPATDIAGSLVMYAFGEFGWAAPLYFAAVLVAFVLAALGLARLFGSDSGFHLWTLSLLLSYVVLADNATGYRMFADLRFLLILGVLHGLIGFLLPKTVAVISSGPQPIRTGVR